MGNHHVRIPDLILKKKRGNKISMLTAYDATMATLLDEAGVDALLVGDSVGMVMLGYENTVPVTLEMMIHHTRAVTRGTKRALVIADMPFMTYQLGVAEAVRHAARLIQEGGAAAIKLEGGFPVIDVVTRLVQVGIPVMGHLGLLPQSVHQIGGHIMCATRADEATALVHAALALEEAGAFAIVLEAIPSDLAAAVTARLTIPTIGIGAGPDCDGQILVSHDMLGLFTGHVPSFVRQYAHLADTIRGAVSNYVGDVRAGQFPLSAARHEPASLTGVGVMSR
jgi:3-methyl-2-oxobutanoate hydroxymethyltransferase